MTELERPLPVGVDRLVTRSPLTSSEQAMLDNARPSERVIVRDFFELLDARLVPDVRFDHVYAWGNNDRRAELKGRRCRVLARGAKNTVLVEFEDGEKVTTSRNAVRLVTEGGAAPDGSVVGATAAGSTPATAPPSVTEPLFPMHKKEAA